MNTIILFFAYLNLKAPQQGRPKTNRFWVDVFPYLMKNEDYNSFQKHFPPPKTSGLINNIIKQTKQIDGNEISRIDAWL
ncbi:3367_t:CDS:2 [Scutellospora calospora]|uniref:3367_t:CDS:1 n=1 Tax=Scutellospora calospora TaxID=85575 RepID=A0ACA9JX60_9GLOM|nr:3367_t:CDS:2 [Scutellospora calospora]